MIKKLLILAQLSVISFGVLALEDVVNEYIDPDQVSNNINFLGLLSNINK